MRQLLVPLLLLITTTAYSQIVQWPFIVDPKITSCDGTGILYDCNRNVWYASGGTSMREVNSLVPPPVFSSSTRVDVYGVHCAEGGPRIGAFRQCSWDRGGSGVVGEHAPTLHGKCELKDPTRGWELTEDSDCSTSTTWGYHTGADPGGECVVFGVYDAGSVVTPFGRLDAVTVANSGNYFCVKPLPPNVKCEITAPSVIDLGTVSQDGMAHASVHGAIDCGSTPHVEIVGGGTVEAAPGVVIKLAARVETGGVLNLDADVNVGASGAPGGYSVAYVIVASPY